MNLIVHAADLHFGANDPLVLRIAADFIADLAPDAVAIAGDLTQSGHAREFKAARDWINALARPAIVVPGNHDVPKLNLAKRVAAPFDRFARYFGDLMQPLRVGPVSLLPLNTARGWQARPNWAEGVVWMGDMDAALAHEHALGQWPFIVCHHPFDTPQDAPMRTDTKRGARASARLADEGGAVLLTGHVHTPHVQEITHRGGAYLALSAGTLSRRTRGQPESLNVLRIDGDTLTARIHNWNGAAFAPSPEVSFARRRNALTEK